MTLPDFTPFNIFILLLAGLASFVSSNAKKTGRILAPIFWAGMGDQPRHLRTEPRPVPRGRRGR